MKKLLSNVSKFTLDNAAKLQFLLKRLYFLFFLITLSILLYAGYLAYKYNVRITPEFQFIYETPQEDLLFKKFAYISGSVQTPGVYEITDQTRLQDLVSMAGGFTEGADIEKITKNINLAEIVRDEQHVFIPDMRETLADEFKPQTSNPKPQNSLININSASSAELDGLPGIGPSTAEKIIDNRPYESIEDLKDVSGIGDKTFEDIAELITVQ